MQRILPLYDNALTRDWLMTFLLDLGVAGKRWRTPLRRRGRSGWQRPQARGGLVPVRSPAGNQVDAERFQFPAGEAIRLFFSWRHTPALVRSLLSQHGLSVLDQWITRSGEEGVFLVSRVK